MWKTACVAGINSTWLPHIMGCYLFMSSIFFLQGSVFVSTRDGGFQFLFSQFLCSLYQVLESGRSDFREWTGKGLLLFYFLCRIGIDLLSNSWYNSPVEWYGLGKFSFGNFKIIDSTCYNSADMKWPVSCGWQVVLWRIDLLNLSIKNYLWGLLMVFNVYCVYNNILHHLYTGSWCLFPFLLLLLLLVVVLLEFCQFQRNVIVTDSSTSFSLISAVFPFSSLLYALSLTFKGGYRCRGESIGLQPLLLTIVLCGRVHFSTLLFIF